MEIIGILITRVEIDRLIAIVSALVRKKARHMMAGLAAARLRLPPRHCAAAACAPGGR